MAPEPNSSPRLVWCGWWSLLAAPDAAHPAQVLGVDAAPACPGFTLGPQLAPLRGAAPLPLLPDTLLLTARSFSCWKCWERSRKRLSAKPPSHLGPNPSQWWFKSSHWLCSEAAAKLGHQPLRYHSPGEPVLIRGENTLLWERHAEFPWLRLLKDDCTGRWESYSLTFALINQKYLKYNLPYLR